MELTRAIAIAVIAGSLGLAAAVHAQSLKNVDTPSEFPPASYTGKQYVDSKGCVYIRAGVDGATTWVPRMTRDRKVICGYKPSIPNAKPNTASATKLDKNVVVIQPAAPPTSETAAAPAPKPKPKPKSTTTQTKPKPATTTTAAKPPAAKPATKTPTTTTTTAATTTATKPATTTATTTKPKSNGNSWWNWATKPSTKTTTTTTAEQPPETKPKSTTTTPTTTTTATAPTTTTTTPSTTNTRRTLDQPRRQTGFSAPCRDGVRTAGGARCGPQAELPYTPGTGNPTAPPPRIIYKRQGASLAPTSPAPGTVVREGQVAANVRVVPAHVYEDYKYANNARVVPDGYRAVFDDGRLNPHRAEQTFAGKASMDAMWDQSVPRRQFDDGQGAVVVSTKSTPAQTPESASTAIVSTKSASDEKAIRLSGQSYVQVRTYSNADAAQKSARQIRALGMPAKIGKYTKNGQTYRIVLAGPYGSQEQADAAAVKAQQAGYTSAFVRN